MISFIRRLFWGALTFFALLIIVVVVMWFLNKAIGSSTIGTVEAAVPTNMLPQDTKETKDLGSTPAILSIVAAFLFLIALAILTGRVGWFLNVFMGLMLDVLRFLGFAVLISMKLMEMLLVIIFRSGWRVVPQAVLLGIICIAYGFGLINLMWAGSFMFFLVIFPLLLWGKFFRKLHRSLVLESYPPQIGASRGRNY